MNYSSKPWLKFYDPWVAKEISKSSLTFKDYADQTLKNFPNRPAFHFFDLTWTYRELFAKADRFAHALGEYGLHKGDVLAINLVNTPQYLIAMAGALKAGVTVSGLPPLLTQDEMAYQLSDLGAKAIITHDYLFKDRVAIIAPTVESLKLVIVTGLLGLAGDKSAGQSQFLSGPEVRSLTDLLEEYSPAVPQVALGPEDIAFIQYTGGTTGSPKGAMLTHRNMGAIVAELETWINLKNGEDVMLCPFPMYHVGGLVHTVQSFLMGFTQILVPDPRNLDYIVQQMGRYKPTLVGMVPTLAMLLSENPGFKKLDVSSIKFCTVGAAPVPEGKAQDLEEAFGVNKMGEVYGLTETFSLLTANPKSGVKKVGSIGIPLPSTRLKLVDLETGEREVPAGQEGEIIANGPQIMKGYYNKPEETAKALRKHDGEVWLHTGDIARMDEDGYFYIVDRAKDMIIVGGYKVFSNDVEQKLSIHPAIELCAIVGFTNPERPGSELVKLVVKKSGSYANRPEESVRDDILAFAREKLAPYKIPKVIEFVESIPLTSVGKIDKKALRSN
ncbi:MAG TPA: AMP-binding protein [Syntrophorhabdales bacterium]|nr:AMP-binding protein [Syntrophorhabdales bacterium]